MHKRHLTANKIIRILSLRLLRNVVACYIASWVLIATLPGVQVTKFPNNPNFHPSKFPNSLPGLIFRGPAFSIPQAQDKFFSLSLMAAPTPPGLFCVVVGPGFRLSFGAGATFPTGDLFIIFGHGVLNYFFIYFFHMY